MITENLEQVRKNIEEACRAVNRDPGEVTLISVSKTKPVSMLQEAYDAGSRDFGENKVQEIMDKYPQLPSDIRWHMIGHLQRNKVKYIVDKVALIHSVDSLRLAETIENEAAKHNVTVPILIEVNVAQEESKFGLKTEEVLPLIEEIASYSHIKVMGLMTIAPFVADPEENRSVEDQILKKIECEQLHKFLLELSKEEQWLIQELYFEERTEREVASVLGLSQKAINKRRQKILEKLRKLF